MLHRNTNYRELLNLNLWPEIDRLWIVLVDICPKIVFTMLR